MAEENAEAAAETAPAPAAPSGGPNKMVLILTAVNLLFTLGIGGVLFVSFQKEKGEPSIADIHNDPHAAASGDKKEEGGHGGGGHGEEGGKKADNEPILVKLDQFTINLSTPGSALPKFVRVNIALEMTTSDSKGEIEGRMPQVRNTVIDLFNSKRPADLATQQARELLKEEIQNHVNTFIKQGKVKGVYFTNFALSS